MKWNSDAGLILRTLENADMIGMVVADRERFLEVNTYVLKLLCATAEDVEAGRIDWRSVGSDAESISHKLCETEWSNRKGERVPVLVGGTALEGGKFLLLVVDQTAHKKLQQSERMEIVSRLAGGVARDFNNLLTVISGYSGIMLARAATDKSARESMEEISRAAKRGADLTRQLLLFSRNLIAEKRILRLDHVVEEIEPAIRQSIGENVQLTLHLNPNAGAVNMDRSQLERVILNLAVNSRDAMPRGGTLTIETEAAADNVMLVVQDTGAGFSREAREHMFEPFYTTKDTGSNTGLGLAVVHGIVHDAGGRITVESEPGKGCSFRIEIPRATQQEERQEPTPIRPSTTGTETVLVVDDEKGVRMFVRRVLQNAGYQVLEAKNGVEALVVARQHPGSIHLLLTDVVMPDMGGVALVERFITVRPGVPTLWMSGYNDQNWLDVDLRSSYLEKPFDRDSLLRRVRQQLDRVS